MAHVLVIEDDADTARLLCKLVARTGHEVTCACNGLEALGILRQTAPDVIVTDLMMPVMDGADFLVELRGDARGESIPVIVVTGAGDSLLLGRAERYGTFKTFIKGAYDVRALLGAIDDATAGAAPHA